MISTKYLNNVFKVLPTPTLVLLPDSPSFTIVEVNEAYLSLTNSSRAELIGQSFFKVFSGNSNIDLHELREPLEDLLKKKEKTCQVSIPLKSVFHEQIRYVSIENTPILNDSNEIELILRSVADVTATVTALAESKIAITDSQNNENVLQETQRVTQTGSWELDLVDNELKWSEALKELYEVETDYHPDLDSFMIFFRPGKNRELMMEAIKNAIQKGCCFDLELDLVTAKGNRRLVRASAKTEKQDGNFVKIYGVIKDITEEKTLENALLDSKNQFQSLLQSIDGIVWETDAESFEFTFISDQVKNILGYTPDEWLSDPLFWQNHIYSEDREQVIAYCHSETKKALNHTLDYRMLKKDGDIVWIRDIVSVIAESGKPKWLRGLMVDITKTKLWNNLEHWEKTILELNSRIDVSFSEILSAYLMGIEELFPKMLCSILKVKNNRLYNWSSPSLPQTYIDAIEGLNIGENMGSCGTAAFLKEKVIVSDIEHDPRWIEWKDVALAANLKACWSHPILNKEGNVMATFALYYFEPKLPSPEELKGIDRATTILTVILENRQTSEALRETALLMAQSQDMAHIGNWVLDLTDNSVTWSDTLYTIFGRNKESYTASFENFQEILHPDDKERVIKSLEQALLNGQDTESEERIIRPTGEIRFLKVWSKVISDKNSIPVKMVGACLDITESVKVQKELQSSESRLRGLVNSQTNYVIRVDLEGRYTYYNNKYKEDFGWLYENGSLIGLNSFDSVPEYHHQRLAETGEKCIAVPNQVFQIEIDKFQQNGSLRTTLWHFICLTDSNSSPLEIQCIGIDVTARKEAEDALKISNERYEYVNKATNDAIYDWDIQKDHITWGEGFYRLFKFDINTNEYPLNKWALGIHPLDVDRVNNELSIALGDKKRNKWIEEYRFQKADGSYAYVEEKGYIIRNEQGISERMIGVMCDITDRKAAESELKLLHQKLKTHVEVLARSNNKLEASQKRYQQLFHLSPQPMWIYDLKSLRFIDVNQAAIKHYGYDREEFLSMDAIQIIPDEDVPNLLKTIQQSADQTCLTPYGRFRNRKKNGEIILVDIQSNVIDFNDSITLLILANDITEREGYIDAIEKQNMQLKEIAWMQSHVVRAPLSRIMSLIDLIKDKQIEEVLQTELLDYLVASSNELDEIIREISSKAEHVDPDKGRGAAQFLKS